ncbi:hypothetical protein Tco_0838881 [Tanacetum coccineum]|uniref:Uncharacterized protein n=1 Tax=Tanacetum coccineum TaxID=301880 RepID=A0ABQ5AU41_9ASTR
MALYSNSSTKVDLFEDLRKSRYVRTDEKRLFPTRKKTVSEDFEESGPYLAPTRIVIPRPSFYNISNPEEDLVSSSGAFEDRNNIEDFLEEVKERLRYELHGKPIKSVLVRGCGIETPYSERPSNPKQIAQHIAKHCSGTNSSEFISKYTRILLSYRLRNVLRKASHSTISDEDEKDENDIQSKSFRFGPDDMNVTLERNLSPINLITDVPPTPASVCSSIHEDFYRATYCAGPTTPCALTSNDNDLLQAFRDISSHPSEESITKEQPFEYGMAIELEDEDEAYIQDLLIAS